MLTLAVILVVLFAPEGADALILAVWLGCQLNGAA